MEMWLRDKWTWLWGRRELIRVKIRLLRGNLISDKGGRKLLEKLLSGEYFYDCEINFIYFIPYQCSAVNFMKKTSHTMFWKNSYKQKHASSSQSIKLYFDTFHIFYG